MSRLVKNKFFLAALTVVLALPANSALACAACYGKSDSPLAQGMNWGIFSLLGVIACVLAGIASIGVYFAKRAASFPAIMPAAESLPSTQKA
jgi:hypothetical protein